MMVADARFTISAKDQTKSAFNSVSRGLKGINANVGTLVAGLGGLAAFQATRLFVKQEQAVFQLEARIKSTGGIAGRTSEQLQEMAKSLQGVTTFGDEATIEMQALLLTFTNVRGEIFDQAVPAIQNMATAMGTDLKSNAIQLGKALNDPIAGISAMSRSGIQFTVDQKEMIKAMVESGDTAGAQTVILKELETQFGGAAKAASQGLGGSLKQLNNAFGDLLEGVVSLTSNQGSGGLIQWMTDGVNFINTQVLPAFDFWLVRLGLVNRELSKQSHANLLAELDDLTGKSAELERRLGKKSIIRRSLGLDERDRADLDATTLKIGEVNAAIAKINDKTLAKLLEDMDRRIAERKAAAEANRTPDPLAVAVEDQARTPGLDPEVLYRRERNAQILAEQTEADDLLASQRLAAAHTQLGALRRIAQAEKLIYKGTTTDAVSFIEQQTRGVGQQNRAMFNLNKAAGISQAIINAHAAASQALAHYPPPYSFALAGIAYAAGLARVNAIRSTTFGGGGGGGSSPSLGGTGGGTSPPVNTVPIELPGNGPSGIGGGNVNRLEVHVHGVVTPEVMQRVIIPALSDEAKFGELVLFTSESAQAAELRGDI